MKLAPLLLLLALQDGEAERVLEKFARVKPGEKDLAFFAHDWAPSLAEAKTRAAKEGRPVFLIVLGNLNGYDNLYTGHC